jgi:hypothetical protein
VYAAGAGALAAVVIVVAILIARRGSVAASSSPLFDPEATSPARPAEPQAAAAVPAPAPADPPEALPPAPAPPPAAPAPPPAAPSASPEPSPPGADAPSRPAKRHPPAPRPAPPPRPAAEKINPEELYREGLQAWIRGDGKTGLALCKRVIQANPSFAPPWRVIGLIYEKSGEKANARNAFEKYLHLAPNAPDAPGIRDRLDAL